MSASLAVQRALFAALTAALGSDVSGVFDAVPDDAALPYVTLGPDVVGDWSSKTGQGREHRVALNVWDAGPGSLGVKLLLARVEAAVLALAGDRNGHRIASVLFVRSFVARDPDGATRGTAEFRIRTEQL